jgi:quercetin dioxygenase-like cupin family protein
MTKKPPNLCLAKYADISAQGYLIPHRGPFSIQMAKSQGTARELLPIEDGMGADEIHFKAGEGVEKHIHPGSHILIVMSGHGELDYFDETIELKAGMIYRIRSLEPHAVRASEDSKRGMSLLVIGNDHRPADSSDRLEIL